MNELFLDTAFALALSAPRDEHHERALTLAEEIEANQICLVNTRAVVLEIGNALAEGHSVLRKIGRKEKPQMTQIDTDREKTKDFSISSVSSYP